MRKQRGKMPGLRFRRGCWQIEKRCEYAQGGWLRESTGLSERAEAERYLIRRLAELEKVHNQQLEGVHTFEEAGLKYLDDVMDKPSAEDIASHLDQLNPFIGHLELEAVHDGTLEPFIKHEQERGLAPKSINNALGVVSAALNKAARVWRDQNGRPWLRQSPPILTRVPTNGKAAKPYSLNWGEQDRLIQELPRHLQDMVLFKVNTGCREQEVCRLRWDWEVKVAELGTSVFIIPSYTTDDNDNDLQMVKNKEDRLVALNSIAMRVIESRRGKNDTYVFTYSAGKDREDHPVNKMNNNAWKRAWRAAGLPSGSGVRKGVHNLKHTLGRRLRAIGCPMETRKVLLGHRNGDITTHYSAAELGELLNWLEKVADRGSVQTPTLQVLQYRVVGGLSAAKKSRKPPQQ